MSRNETFNRLACGNAVAGQWLRYAIVAALFAAVSAFGTSLEVLRAIQAPTRLAHGPGGKIYVTDPKVGSVFICDSDLNVTGELKNLNLPLGIAVGIDGRIYVGCQGTRAIQVYDEDGDFIMNIGEGVLSKPNDIALDLHGNLYVVDSAAHCIRIYNMDGNHLGEIGSFGTGDGEFNFPIAADVAYTTNETGQVVGELFVADQGNDRFHVFDLHGRLLRVFSPGKIGDGWFGYADDEVGTLQSLAIDDQYQIHSLDTQASRVQVWNAFSGEYIMTYGSYGTEAGFLNLPLDIVIADARNGTNCVVVGNSADGRVEVLSRRPTLGGIELSAMPVSESVPIGTTVGSLSLTPPLGVPVTYLLAAETWPYDNAFFEISNASNLVTTQTLDFEQITNMQVRVKALGSDSRNIMLAQTLELSVTDANEAPRDLDLSSSYVLEGLPSGTLVGTFSAFDEDPADTHSYSFASGLGDSGNGNFYIDGENLMTLATFDTDVADLYSIRVRAVDSGALASTNIFDIDIYPTNSIGEADLDGDGISDWWEANFTEITDLDPALDTDGDGVINWDEWVAGTDPTDAGAVFRIVDAVKEQTSDAMILRWRGELGRSYSVYWSTNLTGSMQLIESGIEASPPWNTYTDSVHHAESEGFYRLKVEHAK